MYQADIYRKMTLVPVAFEMALSIHYTTPKIQFDAILHIMVIGDR